MLNEESKNYINIYNQLTEFSSNPTENFLNSLKYKISGGNKLVEILKFLNSKLVKYTIVCGFNELEEGFNKFKRCRLMVLEDEVNFICDLLKREFGEIKIDRNNNIMTIYL